MSGNTRDAADRAAFEERIAYVRKMKGWDAPELPDALTDPIGYLDGLKAQRGEAQLAELADMERAAAAAPDLSDPLNIPQDWSH
jgi:hypothetical protein